MTIVRPKIVKSRAPIISIIPKRDMNDLLSKYKIMLGKGHFYAVRPLIDMNIPLDPGVIRISFLHYTSMSEIDQLIQALDKFL